MKKEYCGTNEIEKTCHARKYDTKKSRKTKVRRHHPYLLSRRCPHCRLGFLQLYFTPLAFLSTAAEERQGGFSFNVKKSCLERQNGGSGSRTHASLKLLHLATSAGSHRYWRFQNIAKILGRFSLLAHRWAYRCIVSFPGTAPPQHPRRAKTQQPQPLARTIPWIARC